YTILQPPALLRVTEPLASRSEMAGGKAEMDCLKSPISASVGSRRELVMRMRAWLVVAGDFSRMSRRCPTVVSSSDEIFSAATHSDPFQTSMAKDSIRWPRWSTASCNETTSKVTAAGSVKVNVPLVLPGAASHQVSRFPSNASDGLWVALEVSA